MNILTKRGSLDNVITYEHYCDTKSDLANIPKSQITLGSTAIVLQDEDGGMGIYIAGSDKQWVAVSTSSGGSSGGATTLELIHICAQSEYDSSTGLPTIEEPEENIIYLVPNEDEETNNLFDEYIYTNNNWEKIGSIAATIHDIPTGGTVNQILMKTSNTDYAMQWSDIPTELPAVSSLDDGKIMRVVNGQWAASVLSQATGVGF